MQAPKNLPPDDALDLFVEEARAGASDAWLAEQADVSLRQVLLWRKKRGLISDQGPVMETLSALRGLAESYEPQIHQTKTAWNEPEFVLRQPLDYTLFARTCFTLAVVVGYTTEQIAKALGVRKHDVTLAQTLWRRQLAEHGSKCLGCDVLVDSRFGSFCSRRCHELAINR